jgi:hypothetical protein
MRALLIGAQCIEGTMIKTAWGLGLGLALYGAALSAQEPVATDRDHLARRYATALMNKIEPEWIRPESVTPEQRCAVQVLQLPGGRVVDARIRPDCEYDAAGQRSVEAAVYRASPLPYAGFESVFSKQLTLNFQAKDIRPRPVVPLLRRMTFQAGRPERFATYIETCLSQLQAALTKTNESGRAIRALTYVAVAADGRVKEGRIVRPADLPSSDRDFAEMRAFYLRVAGSCAAFPPEIKDEADVLEIEAKLRLR